MYILFSFTWYMTWPEKLCMHVSSKFSNFGVLWLFELGVKVIAYFHISISLSCASRPMVTVHGGLNPTSIINNTSIHLPHNKTIKTRWKTPQPTVSCNWPVSFLVCFRLFMDLRPRFQRLQIQLWTLSWILWTLGSSRNRLHKISMSMSLRNSFDVDRIINLTISLTWEKMRELKMWIKERIKAESHKLNMWIPVCVL